MGEDSRTTGERKRNGMMNDRIVERDDELPYFMQQSPLESVNVSERFCQGNSEDAAIRDRHGRESVSPHARVRQESTLLTLAKSEPKIGTDVDEMIS